MLLHPKKKRSKRSKLLTVSTKSNCFTQSTEKTEVSWSSINTFTVGLFTLAFTCHVPAHIFRAHLSLSYGGMLLLSLSSLGSYGTRTDSESLGSAYLKQEIHRIGEQSHRSSKEARANLRIRFYFRKRLQKEGHNVLICCKRTEPFPQVLKW